MQKRNFGRTGLQLGVLGFGCGAVGGLMVRGTPAEQERVVARAIAAGVNYFDTAADYGTGESEKTLGRVLRNLGNPDVVVGTKLRLLEPARGRIADALAEGIEASLKRLGRDHVDLYQLHNPITAAGDGDTLSPATVLEEVVPALERLRDQGKTRFIGITGIGDTPALREVVESERLDSAQIPLNLLNPSPMALLPDGFPAHDFGQIMLRAQQANMGVIGIRALAGGALSGDAGRHPIAMPQVPPIGSSATYEADLANARRFLPLVDEGHAGSLVEAALRFTISNNTMGTVLVGFSSEAHLEEAIAAVEKGALSSKAMDRISAIHDEIGRAHA